MTPDVWLNRGIAAKKAGRPEIAERAFIEYRTAAGDDARPSVGLDLAEILVVQERYAEARAELNRFIENGGDKAGFATRIASLERAFELLDRPDEGAAKK